MKKRTTLAAALVAVVAAVAAGFAVAGSRDDHEQPITGTALTRAAEVALAETGGGRVTETEVEDEDAYYEVEVTLPDGRQVDVHLDRSFAVVTSTADADDSDGDESD
ncbi:MAG TPA: PepSY domain-containing protein [Gaiellaceae bacterium]|nr:PepSY domain-containing protein [Gaiellaceae bacterium]